MHDMINSSFSNREIGCRRRRIHPATLQDPNDVILFARKGRRRVVVPVLNGPSGRRRHRLGRSRPLAALEVRPRDWLVYASVVLALRHLLLLVDHLVRPLHLHLGALDHRWQHLALVLRLLGDHHIWNGAAVVQARYYGVHLAYAASVQLVAGELLDDDEPVVEDNRWLWVAVPMRHHPFVVLFLQGLVWIEQVFFRQRGPHAIRAFPVRLLIREIVFLFNVTTSLQMIRVDSGWRDTFKMGLRNGVPLAVEAAVEHRPRAAITVRLGSREVI